MKSTYRWTGVKLVIILGELSALSSDISDAKCFCCMHLQIATNASLASKALMLWFVYNRVWVRQRCIKRRTLLTYLWSPIMSGFYVVLSTIFRLRCSGTSSLFIDSCGGHWWYPHVINSGPWNHRLLFTSFDAVAPLDTRSAGLFDDGTWAHVLFAVFCCIFVTRLATKTFHLEGSPFIHASVILLSDQQKTFLGSTLYMAVIATASSDAIIATHSSSVGKLTVLVGTTLDLAHSRDDVVFWWSAVTAYAHVP